MTDIRPAIAAILPTRMSTRPIDHRGYPVPWFVTIKDDDDRWDFRVLDPKRVFEALRRNVCWICGGPLGSYLSFAVGPMCGINRISAEPPQHRECAEFAARACPFMLLPKAKRREANLPSNAVMDELHIPRNPGVMLIWTTRSFQIVRRGGGQAWLYRMGEPTDVSFWREGRPATRAEIDESVTSGLPNLTRLAEQDGPDAIKLLAEYQERFTALLPAW